MNLFEKIKSLFGKKKAEPSVPIQPENKRLEKPCLKCGQPVFYYENWEHTPNYCKACKRQFDKEKENKQRSGAPRKIVRKCKQCGKSFSFPSTIAHYPNYCRDCRERFKVVKKEK